MKRRLIIDGNAVYELDEDCMLKKRLKMDEKDTSSHEEEKKRVVHENKMNRK